LEFPLIQAGMEGDMSSARLVAAVSIAAGLGTVGFANIKIF